MSHCNQVWPIERTGRHPKYISIAASFFFFKLTHQAKQIFSSKLFLCNPSKAPMHAQGLSLWSDKQAPTVRCENEIVVNVLERFDCSGLSSWSARVKRIEPSTCRCLPTCLLTSSPRATNQLHYRHHHSLTYLWKYRLFLGALEENDWWISRDNESWKNAVTLLFEWTNRMSVRKICWNTKKKKNRYSKRYFLFKTMKLKML